MEGERVRRNVLSINNKLSILKELNAGGSLPCIAGKYGISTRTIYRIRRNKISLRKRKRILQKLAGNTEKKRFTGIEDTRFEKILFKWVLQQRNVGQNISCSELQSHARYLNNVLGGSVNFKASKGWLQKFQQRHFLGEAREKVRLRKSAPTKKYRQFVETFRHSLDLLEINLENVYNVDEKGLLWKSIPCDTSVSQTDVSSESSLDEDRVTLVACANATGTHTLPLLVVGNEKLELNNNQSQSVHYLYQNDALVDRSIFKNWFINIFIPSVEAKNQSRKENILLLMDNAYIHSTEELKELYPQCTVFLLPVNIPPSFQPMEQGVFDVLKRAYRQNFCSNLLLYQTILPGSIEVLLNNCTLFNCLKMLSSAWATVNKRTIRNAWRRVLRNDESLQEDYTEEIEKIKELIKELLVKPVNTKDIENWLAIDKDDPGWKLLSIDEMMQLVLTDEAPVKMCATDEEEDKNIDQINDTEDTENTEMALNSQQEQNQLFLKCENYAPKETENDEQVLYAAQEEEPIRIKMEQYSADEMEENDMEYDEENEEQEYDSKCGISLINKTSCMTASDAYTALSSVHEWLMQRTDTDPEYIRAIDIVQHHISNIALREFQLR